MSDQSTSTATITTTTTNNNSSGNGAKQASKTKQRSGGHHRPSSAAGGGSGSSSRRPVPAVRAGSAAALERERLLQQAAAVGGGSALSASTSPNTNNNNNSGGTSAASSASSSSSTASAAAATTTTTKTSPAAAAAAAARGGGGGGTGRRGRGGQRGRGAKTVSTSSPNTTAATAAAASTSGGGVGGSGRSGMSLIEQRSLAANADPTTTTDDSEADVNDNNNVSGLVGNGSSNSSSGGGHNESKQKKGNESKVAAAKKNRSIWDTSTSDEDSRPLLITPSATTTTSSTASARGGYVVGGRGVAISVSRGGRGGAGGTRSSSSGGGASRRAMLAAGMYTSTESDTDGDENDQRERSTMLAKTIIEQLVNDTYECSICSNRIGRRGRVWSCNRCHLLLHSTCIDAWYKTKVTAAGPDGIASLSWPCPGCMYLYTEAPKPYTCFCGKVTNPDYNAYITPHSCGAICGKTRGPGCTHPCTMPCHPGFCPPCVAIGPMVTCPCGKNSYRLRCGEVEMERKVCGGICGKTLTCGRHQCTRSCHSGPCAPCEVKLVQTCHCSKVTEPRLCGTSDGDSFSCAAVCARDLSCGNHRCTRVCHAGDCSECRRIPSIPQSCACGKKQRPLAGAAGGTGSRSSVGMGQEVKLAGESAPSKWTRKACTDPMPLCGDVCGRLLNCGTHTCTMTCHDSPCLPCKVIASQVCRCGKTTLRMPCAQYSALKRLAPGREWLCDKPCNKKMTCGRHKCNQKCCIADILAGAVAAEPHVCERQCTQPLDCGVHRCEKFCHLGYCAPCNVVYRDGITCSCGKTKLSGPVKCGTAAPACREQCSRARTCPHKCAYNCHPGDCPPCAVLTKKRCAGGHMELTNIPCHAAVPSCGTPCRKPLSCGQHLCPKLCHSGACDTINDPVVGFDSKEEKAHSSKRSEHKERKSAHSLSQDRSCGQRCNRARKECSHTCREPCHPEFPCPDVACQDLITIYCDCKRISKKVACGLGDPRHFVNRKPLPCDDTCVIEARNRGFRDAFGIKSDEERIQYASAFLDQVIHLELMSFVPRLEKLLADFVANRTEKTKNLPAMPQHQRWLTHQLAVYYGLDTESIDKEPKRTVRLMKGERTGYYTPKMLLSQALKLYRPSSSPPSAPSSTKATITTTTTNSSKVSGSNTASSSTSATKVSPPVLTVDPRTIINFYSVDKETRVFPSDLRAWFSGWEGKFRLNSIDSHHIIAIFTDIDTCNQVRAHLEKSNLARTTPPTRTPSIPLPSSSPSPSPSPPPSSSSSPPSSSIAVATNTASISTTSLEIVTEAATASAVPSSSSSLPFDSDSVAAASSSPAISTSSPATGVAAVGMGPSGWVMYRVARESTGAVKESIPAIHHKKVLEKDGEWTTVSVTPRMSPTNINAAAAAAAATSSLLAVPAAAVTTTPAPTATVTSSNSSSGSGSVGSSSSVWVPSWKKAGLQQPVSTSAAWRAKTRSTPSDAWGADQSEVDAKHSTQAAAAAAAASRSAKTPLTWEEMSQHATTAAAAAAAGGSSGDTSRQRRRAAASASSSLGGGGDNEDDQIIPTTPFLAHGKVTTTANPFAGLNDSDNDNDEEEEEEKEKEDDNEDEAEEVADEQ